MIAWVCWGCGVAFYTYGIFMRVAPGVMVGDLMRDLTLTAAGLGHMAAIYFWIYGAMQLPVGVMADRFGARRLLTAAALMTALGGVVFATATTVPQAYAGRFLVGMGTAASWVGALKLIADWHAARRFAGLTGATLMIGNLGGVMAQAPLALAVEAHGWRATVFAGAALGIALAALFLIALRDKPAEHAHGGGLLAGLRRVAAQPRFWIMAFALSCISAPVNNFITLWGVPYLMATQDLARPAAANLATLVLLGWAAGAPLFGWLGDRTGARRALLQASCAAGACLIAAVLWLPVSDWTLAVMLFGYGVASGGVVVGFTVLREIAPPGASGVAIGLGNMFSIGTVAPFQIAVGELLDRFWGGGLTDGARVYDAAAWNGAMMIYPPVLLAGIVLAFASPARRP